MSRKGKSDSRSENALHYPVQLVTRDRTGQIDESEYPSRGGVNGHRRENFHADIYGDFAPRISRRARSNVTIEKNRARSDGGARLLRGNA